MRKLHEYDLLDCIFSGTTCRITRVRHRSEGTEGVLKQGRDPVAQRLELRQEFELGHRCAGPGVVAYRELVEDGVGVGIVMDDGGAPSRASSTDR